GADNLGYVVATHLEPLTANPLDSTVLTYYQPLPADDGPGLRARRQQLLAGSLDHWCTHVTGQLDAMHPGIERDIRRMHITRWGHAMVRPAPGVLFGRERMVAAAAVGRVQPCASDVAGLPLFEEAFCGGVRAAERALTRLGHPPSQVML
nr:twin-arginine translocation pathway signal [Deltaproteobacteria bacterium]